MEDTYCTKFCVVFCPAVYILCSLQLVLEDVLNKGLVFINLFLEIQNRNFCIPGWPWTSDLPDCLENAKIIGMGYLI